MTIFTPEHTDKRKNGSAAAPCVTFPAEHLAAARDFGIMTCCFRAGFGEGRSGEGQIEADTDALESWTPGRGEGAEAEDRDSRN